MISFEDWSDEGCTTSKSKIGDSGNTNVTCICNHLTSFAVLMVSNGNISLSPDVFLTIKPCNATDTDNFQNKCTKVTIYI